MNSSSLVKKQKTGYGGYWIQPNGSSRDPELLPALFKVIEECFSDDNYNIILNMARVKFPSPSFIAMLIEMTGRARRHGGNIEIVKLTTSAKNNLITFSPLTYLTLSERETVFQEDEERGLGRLFGNQFDDVLSSDVSGRTESAAIDRNIRMTEVPELDMFENEPENSVRELDSSSSGKFENIQQYHIRIPSKVDALYKATDFVIAHAARANMPKPEISKVKIAVYEACLNVIEHAYRSKPTNWINIALAYNPEKFMILIIDKGISNSNIKNKREFDVEMAVDARRTGGMGMHIIHRSMDVVKYETDPYSGNKLIMIKYLKTNEN